MKNIINESTAYSLFCLADCAILSGNYANAIERLQVILNQHIINDDDFCAASQMKLYTIYSLFLNDKEKAQKAHDTLINNYPNSIIVKKMQ